MTIISDHEWDGDAVLSLCDMIEVKTVPLKSDGAFLGEFRSALEEFIGHWRVKAHAHVEDGGQVEMDTKRERVE